MKYFKSQAEEDKYHPRTRSFCYRDAPTENEQGILWYGNRQFCQKNITYGVITICYENPIIGHDLSKKKGKNSSLIVLSGFTGVATFGLAELLAGEYEDETVQLKDKLRKY